MSPSAVVVVHREAMVAEGIASALGRYTRIVPIAATTSVHEGEQLGSRADAVALDASIPGALVVAERLREQGVRVVLLGDEDDGDALSVSTRGPVSALASALVPGTTAAPDTTTLTPRQREILRLITAGLAGKEIARRVGISQKTVEQHKTRIFARLGVRNQTAAASVAFRQGLAEAELSQSVRP